MTIKLVLKTQALNDLNFSIVKEALSPLMQDNKIADYEQQLQFAIDYQQEADDPRELS